MSELLVWPGLAASAWVVAALAVLAGTMLQRLAGQGFGMIAAPMVAMVAPEFVPATLLLVGIAVGLSSTAVDLRLVERADLPAGFAGRAAGAVLAALVAQRLAGDPALVAWVVGGTVYLGIALSLLGVRVAISRLSLFGAGVTAGLMGTLTAVGAPPMALLYQYHEARRSAAMQNVFFFWGMTVSILALAWQGLVGLTDLVLALSLLPMVALGVALAGLVARGDPLGQGRARMRPVALGLAALAATALIVTRAI